MQAINRRVMESLVKAGAMDSLEGTRAQLLLALDAAIETGNRAAKDRDSGQGGLFGGGPAEEAHPGTRASQSQRLDAQGEAAGREGTARLLCHRASARQLRRQDRGTCDARFDETRRSRKRRRSRALRDDHRRSEDAATAKANRGHRW